MTEKLVKNKFFNKFGQKGQIWNRPEVFKHSWVKCVLFFKRGLTTADFIHEGIMPVAKDWCTMVVSRGTTWSEHSNSKDVGIESRTHVLGDICFMHFNTASWVTVSNPHKGVPEKRRSQRLCEGGWTTCLSMESRIFRNLLTKKTKQNKIHKLNTNDEVAPWLESTQSRMAVLNNMSSNVEWQRAGSKCPWQNVIENVSPFSVQHQYSWFLAVIDGLDGKVA